MASNRDPLEALTEKWEPAIRKAFLEAVAAIRDRVSISGLVARIEAGDIDGAIRAVGLDPNDFTLLSRALTSAFGGGGDAIAALIPAARDGGGALIKILFDIRNPRAEAWLKDRSSTLITEIVSDQQDTIRAHLVAGLEAGQNPRKVALGLVGRIHPTTGRREGGVIGLTSGQEQWQRAYAAELASGNPGDLRKALARNLRDKRFDRTIEKAIREEKPIPAETVEKMVAAYRNRSLRYRAETIARNEAIRSLGAAQTEAYDQAIDRGQVEADQITRFWRTMEDKRVRHTHRLIPGMNKEGRARREPFATPTGPSMHAPHDHDPVCRCREIIRINYFKGLR